MVPLRREQKGDEPDERPVRESLIQYFENAGSVSVESTPGMPWTFVTTDSRRFSRGSALMRATMSESPVVPMISWVSGTFFNSLIVFCVSFERMRDRKSTRLNSSHLVISYAVFCLKKKKTIHKPN